MVFSWIRNKNNFFIFFFEKNNISSVDFIIVPLFVFFFGGHRLTCTFQLLILRVTVSSDYSLGYEFPFRLKAVNKDGTQCAWCPWYRFCRGCEIQCCDSEFAFSSNYIAIDWDPTALHLRYQTSQESVSPVHLYRRKP